MLITGFCSIGALIGEWDSGTQDFFMKLKDIESLRHKWVEQRFHNELENIVRYDRSLFYIISFINERHAVMV